MHPFTVIVLEKIWEYILKGYLAPGRDRENVWIPHIHLTRKGKEFREKLLQENNGKQTQN